MTLLLFGDEHPRKPRKKPRRKGLKKTTRNSRIHENGVDGLGYLDFVSLSDRRIHESCESGDNTSEIYRSSVSACRPLWSSWAQKR